jgi:polygalacturonase
LRQEEGWGGEADCIARCSHVNIGGITIRNARSYNISLLGCDLVTIYGVTIQNGFSDGIDPDFSRNVRISNCFVESVDAAICLKASGALGERRAMEM